MRVTSVAMERGAPRLTLVRPGTDASLLAQAGRSARPATATAPAAPRAAAEAVVDAPPSPVVTWRRAAGALLLACALGTIVTATAIASVTLAAVAH